MFSFQTYVVLGSLVLISQTQSISFSQTNTEGRLPLSVDHVEEIGNVHSNTTFVKRDLGFAGQIGNYYLLSYGDTMYSDANYSDTWRGMTSDSVALATHDPLEVVDVNLDDQGYPQQFCPIAAQYGEDLTTCALGITNVVETYPGQGRDCRPFDI